MLLLLVPFAVPDWLRKKIDNSVRYLSVIGSKSLIHIHNKPRACLHLNQSLDTVSRSSEAGQIGAFCKKFGKLWSIIQLKVSIAF